MESSFFEYRDESGEESDTGTEIIDNSYLDESFAPKKTPAKKNQTAYVPESDDDISGEYSCEDSAHKDLQRKYVLQPLFLSSSDDDTSRKSNIRQLTEFSSEKLVLSSSEDEAQVSPEMVPRRRPQVASTKRSSDSFIGRKVKKRIMLIDSDTDNSIIVEHDKNRKVQCLKETPAKMKDIKKIIDVQTMSTQDDESDNDQNMNEAKYDKRTETLNKSNSAENSKEQSKNIDGRIESEQSDYDENVDETKDSSKSQSTSNNNCEKDNKETKNNLICNQTEEGSKENLDDQNVTSDIDHTNSRSSSDKQIEETDEEQDEDFMVMSRATRMSIMGVIPKENESDDSDYIQSEDSRRPSRSASESSLPEVTLKSPEKVIEDGDSSRITCSPFSSPLRDITNTEQEKNDPEDDICDLTNFYSNDAPNKGVNRLNKENKSKKAHTNQPIDDVCDLTHFDSYDKPNKGISALNEVNKYKNSNPNQSINDNVCDLTHFDYSDLKSKVESRLSKVSHANNVSEEVIDDDITIVDKKPEIIALSSDDEDEQEKETKKSPNTKKSPKVKDEPVKRQDSTIKQYFVPASYPNQVVYVKKHVRENELNKLNGLKEDLQNIRYLLTNMDVDTLPDGGVKLIERLTDLEHQVRVQGDKVANMIVEPDIVTPDVMANDGFNKENKGLSWDDIQKASNAVQPRMFGKQAMSTHMAERNLILDRLRDLYESLASRPSEKELATQPAALRSSLMEHQLHALAWLRWRETQSPPGGILADDMGLGKTITMISLVATDKEKIQEDDDDDIVNSKLVRGGTLVVCPASLVRQWEGEVGKHCAPHALSVCLHHGAARPAQPHRLAPFDLVITTYNILQRESEKSGALQRVRWRRVILDEAHVVRNHKSATSGAVSALRARRRWALTGTPLHNKDLDLFALLKFLRCTPFDDLAMWKKWIDNKSLGGQERLNTIMQCVMLRRTKLQLQDKGQLACLPARTTHDQDVTLHADEMNVYQKVLVFSKTLFAQFLHQRAERQADALGFARPDKDSAYDKMHKKMIALQGAKPVKSHEILVLLLRLRQVCCHCGLIAAMLDDSEDVLEDQGSKDLLAELNKLTLEESSSRRKSGQPPEEEEAGEGEGTSVAEAIRSVLSPHNPVFSLQRQSSKILAVMDCLNQNVFSQSGDKAVVVSQWTSVLQLVERELRSARVPCVTLSGAVPVPKRSALVAALNDPASSVRVMLLSLCAGGVGLNLCGANHLLLLDPHWNPQLEQQAQDRIYRVGQHKPVHIYRFMCLETVEQSIRQLQKAKLEMAENVLTGARNNASKLTIEDLRVLFNMGSQNGI